jgi:hypothetical protein
MKASTPQNSYKQIKNVLDYNALQTACQQGHTNSGCTQTKSSHQIFTVPLMHVDGSTTKWSKKSTLGGSTQETIYAIF